jgi:hypothetical protein
VVTKNIDFEVEDFGDDEWLKKTLCRRTKRESGRTSTASSSQRTKVVKMTVNPEFMQRDEPSSPKNVWKGDHRRLKPGEELEFDSDAYKLFHRASVEWSCLSIDVFREPGGTGFPYTSSHRQPGWRRSTQGLRDEVARPHFNPSHDDSEDSDDNEELEPMLKHVSFSHRGAVNRVRLWITRTKSLLE